MYENHTNVNPGELQANEEQAVRNQIASAMSCSLPLPLAIFCASAIWFLTACARVSRYLSEAA